MHWEYCPVDGDLAQGFQWKSRLVSKEDREWAPGAKEVSDGRVDVESIVWLFNSPFAFPQKDYRWRTGHSETEVDVCEIIERCRLQREIYCNRRVLQNANVWKHRQGKRVHCKIDSAALRKSAPDPDCPSRVTQQPQRAIYSREWDQPWIHPADNWTVLAALCTSICLSALRGVQKYNHGSHVFVKGQI